MKFILYLFISIYFILPQFINAELITNSLLQKAEKKYTVQSKNRFIAVRDKLIKDLKDESDMKKLNKVNSWINYIKYQSDQKVYGVSDYWATLYEFVGKGMGDCEDYTIAKYYILKELGISPERLKFTYVIYKSRSGKKISHMVLSYLKVPKPKKKSDILILDNNNRLILPASKRTDLIKVVKMINGDTGAKSKKWKKARSWNDKAKAINKGKNMTLFKQMALAVSLIIIVMLGAVMAINYQSSKQDMIQSLYETTANNISTLSNNLADASEEKALLVTTIDAEFDSGYYKKIEYISNDGESDYLKIDNDPIKGVPSWFIDFSNIELKSVSADVTSGWTMAGVVHVTGDTGVVYKALYKMFKSLLYVFIVSVIISLIILAVILHFVLKPLKEVQKQAEAVGRNEFIFQKTIPNTKEFKEVVLAMNKMVSKVKATFDKGNEELKRQKELEYIDPTTKLRNRKYLIDKLPEFLKVDASSKGGVNIMTSLSGLIEANEQIGHRDVDRLFNDIADIFRGNVQDYQDAIIARMNGTEFSILLPNCPSINGLMIAETIAKMSCEAIEKYELDSDVVFVTLGVYKYNYKQNIAQLLSGTDNSLAQAKFKDSKIHLDKADIGEEAMGKDDWRILIHKALDTNSFEFVSWTAVDSKNLKIAHHALSLSMHADDKTYYYGQFMASANQIGLSSKIYQNIMNMMFKSPDMKLKDSICSIRLSFEYMDMRETYTELSDLLKIYSSKLPFKLILEIPDKMFRQNSIQIQEYKALFEKYNIDMGIYEFIGESDDYQYLQDLRPVYIKGEPSYFLTQSDQALSALRLITDTVGITLIATGVMSIEALEKLQAKDIHVIQGKVTEMIELS